MKMTRIQLDPASIRGRWRAIRGQRPESQPSEIASEIGVTEGELMAARIGDGVTRLRPDWQSLLSTLNRLGRVVSLTRNSAATMEKKGQYPEFQHFGIHSIFVGREIDLRISLGFWGEGFAVAVPTEGKPRLRSLQFFAKDGTSVHTALLEDSGSIDDFEAIAEEFVDRDQSARYALDLSVGERRTRPLFEIDRDELLQDWAALQSTQDFFGLVHKHRTSRHDAFALAAGRFTRQVAPSALRRLVSSATEQRIPLMTFVGNPACVQIHKGTFDTVMIDGGCLKATAPDTAVTFWEKKIQAAWVVRKPTQAGEVASLELFDSKGKDIASFFGLRAAGGKQEDRWHRALDELPEIDV